MKMGEDKKNKVITNIFDEFKEASKEKETKLIEPYIEKIDKKELLKYKGMAVKAKMDKVVRDTKRKRLEKQHAGIDTFDQRIIRKLHSVGLMATFYRWRTNRKLKPLKQAEKEEKEGIMSTFDLQTKLTIYGIVGVIAIIVLLYALDNLFKVIPALVAFWYIKTHLVFKYNAKLFDFDWIHKIVKKDDRWKKLPVAVLYFKMPLHTLSRDSQLEDYLEERGRKGMASGQKEYASITKSSVQFDETYGWVRIFSIDNRWFRKPVVSLEEVELTDYFLIPQRTSGNKLTTGVYYQSHGEVHQSVAGLIGEIERSEFIDQIAQDDAINYAFPEIAERIEALKAEQEAQAQAEREAREEAEMMASFKSKGLNDRAIKIVMRLKKNQEDWGISVRDLFGRSMEFTKNYLKVRVDLMNGTSIESLKNNSSKMGSKVGIKPMVLEAENASSAYLMFVLNQNIKGHKVSVSDIKEEANKGELTLGEGLLGTVKVNFPRGDSPAFGIIGGLSRSGKSTLGTMMFTSMAYLNDGAGNYDYSDFFIASVKDEDYIANGFKKSGMLVVSDVFEIYNMLKLVDEIATKRKNEFLEIGTINISQYNKKSTEKMGKIIVIMDEYANTLTKASNFKVDTEAGNIALDKAVEALVVKIAQEHGSRGVSLFVLTQQFSKGAMGKVADVLGSRFLGYAKENVWMSQDPSKQVSNYLKTMEDTTEARRGRFFISAPDFGYTKDTKVQKIGSEWAEVKTNFAETSEYAKNFDRQFNTSEKYLKQVQENFSDVESSESAEDGENLHLDWLD